MLIQIIKVHPIREEYSKPKKKKSVKVQKPKELILFEKPGWLEPNERGGWWWELRSQMLYGYQITVRHL